MKRVIMVVLALMMAVLLPMLTGCTEAERASYNLSKQADNFNVIRQLTVINCIEGDVIFQMTGKLSIEADEVDKQLSEAGEPPVRREGLRSDIWVLMDFGCVIVHVFTDEARKFYDLERLWSDAEVVESSSLQSP